MKFYKASSIQASYFLFFISFIMMLSSLKLIMNYQKIMMEFIFFEYNSVLYTFPIFFEWYTTMFSSIVCFISGCVMIFTFSYMSSDVFMSRFVWLVMLFVLSMNFFIFIPSLVSLLLGWDGLGLVSFCLVIYYQNSKSLGAGLMTVFMNRVGDCAILLSIGFVFSMGHFNSEFFWNFDFMGFVIIMLMIAGLTKSAQLPFSSWLPAAMAAPTPVSALVHSSTLVTAGVFLLIRFYTFLESMYLFNFLLLMISSMTMIMAGLAANLETDLKKIIALSTLSQLGIMMFSISLKLFNLALFHLFVHAMFKALLFLCAGNIIHCHMNNQDIRKMGFLWNQLPVTSTCFNIANFALCGFPFLAGFYSKDCIIEMMVFYQTNIFITLNMMITTFLTAAYSARLFMIIFLSKMTQSCLSKIYDEDKMISTSLILLSLMAIMGGAIMSWLFFSPMVIPVINQMDKLLAFLITLIGGILTYKLFSLTEVKKLSHKIFFCFNMWFMVNLSNNFVSKPFLDSGSVVVKSLDLGWLEMMGGEGLFKKFIILMSLNQKNQSNLFNFFIFLSFITIIFIPIILYM
uniref:NADH-ubiquinone oxidoreductase chain 5 n=1 Tax=Cyanoplax caverna TaxID=1503210 RepID=A0A0E3DE39_9MOLL|nr:NADH dehydrogenase subunit 5 [Cyanoplax caverna]AIA77056.1 NADH dehydrogenase subunit 5 [Cyanoplax caverna]